MSFTYRYISADKVVIVLDGQTYKLDRYAEPLNDLPFTYRFENDGDLDVELRGVAYDLDSPYDIDRPKKAKKKIKKKKTVRKSKSTSNYKKEKRK